VGIQGSPKVRCDLLFWLDVGTASDRATRWALVTFWGLLLAALLETL